MNYFGISEVKFCAREVFQNSHTHSLLNQIPAGYLRGCCVPFQCIINHERVSTIKTNCPRQTKPSIYKRHPEPTNVLINGNFLLPPQETFDSCEIKFLFHGNGQLSCCSNNTQNLQKDTAQSLHQYCISTDECNKQFVTRFWKPCFFSSSALHQS